MTLARYSTLKIPVDTMKHLLLLLKHALFSSLMGLGRSDA